MDNPENNNTETNDTSIEHMNNGSQDLKQHKQAVASMISEMHFVPVSTDIEIKNNSNALRIAFDMLPSAAVGAVSLPEAFRTIKQTITISGGSNLYRVTDKWGAPINPSQLQTFNDGTGFLGSSYVGGKDVFAQRRLHPVDGIPTELTTTLPIDPATLAMAIALAQINQKLDGIQNTLNELMDYLKIKDKANLRASLEALSIILDDYRLNWRNEKFKQAKYNLAQEINRDSRQAIIELRAHISKELDKKGLVELRDQAGKSTNSVLDLMKEYQLALYLHSFSTFLCVVLLENYDAQYLQSKSDDVRQKAIEYRELYTKCYNTLEKRSHDSVDSAIMGGLAGAFKGLGKAVAATPIGDHTQIDEALVSAGEGIGGFNSDENEKLTKRLTEVKEPGTESFAASIDAVNSIYNISSQIYIDTEALYLLQE